MVRKSKARQIGQDQVENTEGAPAEEELKPAPANGGEGPPFWRNKRLGEMSHAEWESLCDGCGRCCMLKLEDEDTGVIYLTRLACRLLDIGKCRCRDYPNRQTRVPDCLSLDPGMVAELSWLPPTCAYRLVSEGRDLAWWHPLVSGRPDTVHEAGISVRDWAIPETDARAEELHKYLIAED